MLTCEVESSTFFKELQEAKELDCRDKRGLRHELAIVLLGVTLAILSNRDGVLSSMHRHMRNHYRTLCDFMGLEAKKVISRSQLPVVLCQVNLSVFDNILFKRFGVRLNEEEKKWFSLDGKELRGSIIKGNKRGEAIVIAVSHEKMELQAQGNYSGDKESEIPLVRKVLQTSGLDSQKVSVDAIHCNPQTLNQINQAGGIYLVGLKDNQAELLQDCTDFIRFNKPNFTYNQKESVKPKHGRKEIRDFEVYDFSKEYKEKRWEKAQINTVIQVKREFTNCKSGVYSCETSFYLSNQKQQYQELCQATRGHWTVEANNYIRDVTFAEDLLKSKKIALQRTMALNRTIANILINQGDFDNKKAQIEDFADNFNDLLLWLKKIKFL